MLLKPIFLLSLLCSPVATAAIVVRHDVSDGAYRVSESRFPFLFALYRTKAGHRDCIATLIAPQWAVTAAHCTEDKAFVEALSSRGYEVSIDNKAALIDRVERSPSTSEGRKVDIALVHLSRPVMHLEPIAVYRSEDELGRVVLLPGWGGRGDGLKGVGAPDGLFRVAENRVDVARDGLLGWEFDDPRGAIERSLPLEGINGPGDSGGPALIMTAHGWATVGVSMAQRTFGRPEGSYGNEEIYARLSDHVEWIDQITGAIPKLTMHR